MEKKKKKYETCTWYFIFILWTKHRLEIVYSKNEQDLVHKLNIIDQMSEGPKPINGSPGIPAIQIRHLSWVGAKRGPTQDNIKENFHNEIPRLEGTKIKFTKIKEK